MYRLLCDETLLAIWDSLPDDASAQLTTALSDVCHEPYIETEPYGIDDGTHRILVRPLVTAILAVNEDARTVRIYSIERRH
ncbi:hypothetical protein [Streptomyces swartbergensis]|uniref:Uncharacterized protein n=1 Tax=Streptomyces swartbergensis TaxID=487165 RepID=A0A243S714_9ACTN|nr:hypothetical protein [Streptomyces swartbergensis]OUD03329.1 hypothetical protein CA983_09985 [Streptomyces swartbergensis]